MVYKIQTDPYTLQIGDPKASTTENIKDPNFGKEDGHLDEINPSTEKYFLNTGYNIRYRGDITIPQYGDRDKFPETPTKCKQPDTSDADVILLPPGEYKAKFDAKALKVDCIKDLRT